MVLAVLALILVGKSLAALGIVLVLGYPLSSALTVSAALAQIGEFSFILAGLGVAHGLLPQAGFSLVLAGAMLSIALNPLVFAFTDWFNRWAQSRPSMKARCEDGRMGPLLRLQGDLDAAKRQMEAKAAAHKTFSPEELVEHFPLFAGLTPEQRETLILHFTPREAQPGERIIRAGEEADRIYFISSGQVEVAVAGRKLKIGGGGFFGEMALLSGQARTADVTALDFCKFLTLSRNDFRQLQRRYPDMRTQIAALAAQRSQMNRQFFDEQADDAVTTGA